MNKSQLESIMSALTGIQSILESDKEGASEIGEQLRKLQGTVAQELKNTVWKEYLDTTAAKETPG